MILCGIHFESSMFTGLFEREKLGERKIRTKTRGLRSKQTCL